MLILQRLHVLNAHHVLFAAELIKIMQHSGLDSKELADHLPKKEVVFFMLMHVDADQSSALPAMTWLCPATCRWLEIYLTNEQSTPTMNHGC